MIEKGFFFVELNASEVLDLGNIRNEEWREIERRAKQVIMADQTKNEKIAFVAAFLNFVDEKIAMKSRFDAH